TWLRAKSAQENARIRSLNFMMQMHDPESLSQRWNRKPSRESKSREPRAEGFASFESADPYPDCQSENLLTKGLFPTERYQPKQEVVTSGRVPDMLSLHKGGEHACYTAT